MKRKFAYSLVGVLCALVTFAADHSFVLTVKLNSGIISEKTTRLNDRTKTELTWTPNAKTSEVMQINEFKGDSNPEWTLECGFADPVHIAMIRGNHANSVEYWEFTKSIVGKWELTDRADISAVFFPSDIRITATKRIFVGFTSGTHYVLEVTNERASRRGGIYRKVLKDGKPFGGPDEN